MFNYTYLKSDFKQIAREPIMLLFALLSLLLIPVFKLLVLYVLPVIGRYTYFDVMAYYPYMLVLVYLLQPMMFGTVMGFFMLDEKDAHIFELLRVTPLGVSGYLSNRLLLPVVMASVYAFIGWLVLGTSVHGFSQLLWVILFTACQTILYGLFIAMVSKDKVQGLTYAKGVSVVMVFGFVDLFKSPIVSKIGLLFPQYYVSLAVGNQGLIQMFMGLVVNVLWVILVLKWSMTTLGE